jgi:hypothetical protein
VRPHKGTTSFKYEERTAVRFFIAYGRTSRCAARRTDADQRDCRAEAAHLSARATADTLNRRGITTAGGEEWHCYAITSRAPAILSIFS